MYLTAYLIKLVDKLRLFEHRGRIPGIFFTILLYISLLFLYYFNLLINRILLHLQALSSVLQILVTINASKLDIVVAVGAVNYFPVERF